MAGKEENRTTRKILQDLTSVAASKGHEESSRYFGIEVVQDDKSIVGMTVTEKRRR